MVKKIGPTIPKKEKVRIGVWFSRKEYDTYRDCAIAESRSFNNWLRCRLSEHTGLKVDGLNKPGRPRKGKWKAVQFKDEEE